MGSSIHKKQRNRGNTKISIFNTQSQSSGSLENQWIFEPVTEASFRTFEDNFHHKIQTKLLQHLPLTSAQLLQLLKKEIENTLKAFVIIHRPKDAELTQLKESLQAKTLKYTYLNDKNSYNLYARTIENLYGMFRAGTLNQEEVFTVYKQEVNGTYFLQGLKEIHEIVSAFKYNPEEADSLFQHFQHSSFTNFQNSQDKLKELLN